MHNEGSFLCVYPQHLPTSAPRIMFIKTILVKSLAKMSYLGKGHW